jgi:predicted enzyme related to lactoylglutathione lyase
MARGKDSNSTAAVSRLHRHRARAVALAGLVLVLLAGAGRADLPPIADPPTGEHRHGKFVWIDLVTADVAGARRFYGGLFRWAFAELGDGQRRYTLAYNAGAPVAGIAQREPAPGQARQSRWIAFMSVGDVADRAAQVTAKGGTVLIAPRAVAGRGEMAVLADPDGAPFGLIDSASGDPEDFRAEPGEWIWALYQSPDATSAAAFYQDVGGYDVVPDERFRDTPHFFLVADGYARASLAEIPAARSGMRPDWLYFLRVRDLGATLAQVGALGGKVLVPPSPAVFAGRIAVIADPGGAPLGLMQWDDAEEGA